jgi:hypothetical protein
LGVSFGVKGARISVSNRGTYVNLGANGICYRQRIDGGGSVNSRTPVVDEATYTRDSLHTITTQNVEAVTDVDSRSFIDELESKASKLSFFKWFGLLPSILLLMYAFSSADDIVREEVHHSSLFKITKGSVYIRSKPSIESPSITKVSYSDQFTVAGVDSTGWIKVYLTGDTASGFVRSDMGDLLNIENKMTIARIEERPWLVYIFILLVVTLVTWCCYLLSLDKKRKSLEIYYSLDPEISALHNKFLQCFKEFSMSRKIWQNLHVTGVSNVKYHAGASQLVSRTGVSGIRPHKLPSLFLKTNVSIPCITLRKTELYFFPERLIVERNDVRFIESESLPSDALVIDYTWKFVNRSGGPDKRFNNNRKLPICRYSEYTFQSEGGLLEVITTSKVGAMDEFVKFLQLIGEYQKRVN